MTSLASKVGYLMHVARADGSPVSLERVRGKTEERKKERDWMEGNKRRKRWRRRRRMRMRKEKGKKQEKW
jgi:hypothetical protein